MAKKSPAFVIAGSVRPRRIAEAPAFVFVTPQYDGGYPAALKNAIDHVYKEWAGKLAMIVSCGGHAGEQLQQVLRFVDTTPIATRPALKLPRELIEADAGRIDPAAEFAAHLEEVRQAFAEFAAARRAITPPCRPEVAHP